MNKKYKLFFIPIFFMIFSTSYAHAACTPAPTLANDTIECTGTVNGTFALNDPGGSDVVNLNSVSGNAAYWLDKALGGDPATDGNDTFTAHNSTFFWVLTFRGDDNIGVYDSNFSNIYADTNPGHGVSQRGNDTIYIENSVSNGWILGGNDSDAITIKDSRVSFVASGYSDIYGFDYTPFDANDMIILDNVDFGEPNYYYNGTNAPYLPGAVGSGKEDDLIVFRNGGNAFGVSAGHGNDQIIVEDVMLFNDCNYTNDRGNMTYCGIYSDEPYESEDPNSNYALHGDDEIILHNGDISKIVVEGGHGSDLLEIHTSVVLKDANISGGDDRSITDGFLDRLVFDAWVGDLNASRLQNWESIIFDNGSEIAFEDSMLLTGFEAGQDPVSGLPFGLSLQNDSLWKVAHDFKVDGNLFNAAIVNMQEDGQPTGTLTVQNDYDGDHGTIRLDTVLNDASTSLSDKLVVHGDTAGTTVLDIQNINGTGGQTPTGDNEGILIVEVLGNSESNAFELASPPPYAGEYEYKLVQGSNGNWYLQSYEAEPTPPVDSIVAVDDGFVVTTYSPQTKQLPAPGVGSTCVGPFEYVLEEDVRHGSLSLEVSGAYTYTPDADYNGLDDFSYKITSVNCANESNTVRVSISVECASSQTSDGGDALGDAGMLLMLLFTVLIGLYFIRREENRDII